MAATILGLRWSFGLVKVPDPLLLGSSFAVGVVTPVWFKGKGHQILLIIGTLEVTIYCIYICICSIFKKEMLLGFDTDVLYVMYDTV